jgi:hypothetical protein
MRRPAANTRPIWPRSVDLPKNRGRCPEIAAIFGGHIFDRVCDEHGIGHCLAKPYHP